MMRFAQVFEPAGMTLPRERQIFDNRALWKMIYPMLVEQLLHLLVGIIDTMMVSYAGEAAVSGVSLVNQINAICIVVFTALSSGGAVVVSQYIGRRAAEDGRSAAGQLILSSVSISIVLTAAVTAGARPLLAFLFGRVEADVMDACITYLTLTALSFPALALYNGCSALFRSMAKTRVIMYVSLLMNVINVAGNAVGVFVLKAGVAGVAVPSVLARAAAALILFRLCLDRELPIHLRLRDMTRIRRDMIRRILHIAVPNAIENGLFDATKVALSSIVALFGTTQIAANGVAQNFWTMAALFSIVMGPVFITAIGQCAGAGDYEAANYYMRKLLRITYAGTFVWEVTFTGLTVLLLRLFNLTPEARRLVLIMCIIHNVFNALVHPWNFAVAAGLRAAGDVKYTLYSSIFSTVVVRVAFSVILGLWLNLGVIGIALAMVIDWCVRAALNVRRYYSRKWERFRVI